MTRAVLFRSLLALAALISIDVSRSWAEPPPTTAPVAPSTISVVLRGSQTCAGLGACQGAAIHDGFVYLYGDAKPFGVIRQYTLSDSDPPQLAYTNVEIALTRDGQNLINHPTGLTWNAQFGTYLGNTITATKKGTIYHLDWPRMLIERNLDHAILNTIDDDAAVQGSRPEFVRRSDRWLLATADYGQIRNAVRFYDPAKLATAQRTTDPGVLVDQIPCGPWVQQLHWIDERGVLVLAQNQIEGHRWQLTAADPWAVRDLRTVAPFDSFTATNELEGFTLLDPRRCLLVTSSRADNVTFAGFQIRGTPSNCSPSASP
jgi:hypothetical protein